MQLAQTDFVSTRGGTIALSAVAACSRRGIFLLFLQPVPRERRRLPTPMTVLVAKSLIEKGISGDVVGPNGLFQARPRRRAR